VILALGTVLVWRAGLLLDGECTRGCLVEAIVRAVPFETVLVGGFFAAVGVLLLAAASLRAAGHASPGIGGLDTS